MANFKKLLMVVPPNITFDNFVNPSKNTKSGYTKMAKNWALSLPTCHLEL